MPYSSFNPPDRRQPRQRASGWQLPFAASAIISALSSACGGDGERSDAPSDGPQDWVGRTYLLQVPEGNWADPPRIGQHIADFVPGFLFTVNDVTDSSVDVTIGTANAEGVRDDCNPTVDLAAAPAPYPDVELAFPEFLLHVQHASEPIQVTATVYDLMITDVLPKGDSPAREGQLVATMDMRELYPLFTLVPNPTAAAACTLLADVPAACHGCPNDGQEFCLTVTAIGLGAHEHDEPALEPSSTPDLDAGCHQTLEQGRN